MFHVELVDVVGVIGLKPDFNTEIVEKKKSGADGEEDEGGGEYSTWAARLRSTLIGRSARHGVDS